MQTISNFMKQVQSIVIFFFNNCVFYLFKEYEQKPLGNFLSSILNFDSIIPPNKDSKSAKTIKVFFKLFFY